MRHEPMTNAVHLLALVVLIIGLDGLAMHWIGVRGLHTWVQVGPGIAVETACGFLCIAVALEILALRGP